MTEARKRLFPGDDTDDYRKHQSAKGDQVVTNLAPDEHGEDRAQQAEQDDLVGHYSHWKILAPTNSSTTLETPSTSK